jgi:hypothetical protein
MTIPVDAIMELGPYSVAFCYLEEIGWVLPIHVAALQRIALPRRILRDLVSKRRIVSRQRWNTYYCARDNTPSRLTDMGMGRVELLLQMIANGRQEIGRQWVIQSFQNHVDGVVQVDDDSD